MRFKKDIDSELVKTLLDSDYEQIDKVLKGMFIEEFVFISGVYENKFDTEYQIIPKKDGWEVATQYTPKRYEK